MKSSVSVLAKTTEIPYSDGVMRHDPIPIVGTKLAHERRRTLKLMKSLPRGIRIGQWKDGRVAQFFVRYGNPRKLESFESEQERNDKADKLAEERDKHGTSRLNFDPAKWQEFLDWQAKHSKPAMTTREAVTKYMALRLSEDIKKKSDTYIHIRTQLERRFVEKFGDTPLNQITTDDIRDWLKQLRNPRSPGDPMGKFTLKHYRVAVNTFFRRALLEDWVTRNPCEAVKTEKVSEKKRRPMSVHDIFQLFRANRDKPVAPRMALELWGGLRCSAVEDLKKEHIDFEKRSILIVRQKVGDEKKRQGHRDVLWAWLEHATDDCWSMSPGYYDTAKAKAFSWAHIENPGNALRHSCVSYLLALEKSYGPVMHTVQHTRASTTLNYEGAADEEDAALVMKITPEAVLLTWEEFLAANSVPKPSTPPDHGRHPNPATPAS